MPQVVHCQDGYLQGCPSKGNYLIGHKDLPHDCQSGLGPTLPLYETRIRTWDTDTTQHGHADTAFFKTVEHGHVE